MDKHELLIRFDELRQARCLQTGYLACSLFGLVGVTCVQAYLFATQGSATLFTLFLIGKLVFLVLTIFTGLRCLHAWCVYLDFCDEHKAIKAYWDQTRTRKPSFFEKLF